MSTDEPNSSQVFLNENKIRSRGPLIRKYVSARHRANAQVTFPELKRSILAKFGVKIASPCEHILESEILQALIDVRSKSNPNTPAASPMTRPTPSPLLQAMLSPLVAASASSSRSPTSLLESLSKLSPDLAAPPNTLPSYLSLSPQGSNAPSSAEEVGGGGVQVATLQVPCKPGNVPDTKDFSIPLSRTKIPNSPALGPMDCPKEDGILPMPKPKVLENVNNDLHIIPPPVPRKRGSSSSTQDNSAPARKRPRKEE